ncbi:MAG: nhaA [Flaviaesturariibacter sp.]|nr:nhaA [Flaviaesturariibacter sp.]
MRFTHLFRDFTASERSGGLVLLGCTVLSLCFANSDWGEAYIHFWHQKTALPIAGLDLSVEGWINDGLMAVFFLLVGLEIEREIYIGELNSLKAASLPVAGAIGGMVVPALLYFYFNKGTPTEGGFGIPMATDIAFALGMLSLLGKRVPYSLKIFLTALAIIDDLGAIFVIALFYNSGINWVYLGGALGIVGSLLLLNRLKVHKLALYLVPGVFLWYCMLRSGVHPTLAGVLLAFAIPFGKNDETNISYQLQHWLHKPVAFIILPLFALANTGIILEAGWLNNLGTPNGLGILAGLVIGKPVGIILSCWLLTKLNWGKLPRDMTWKHLAGAGILGGIGFTMSIFIANLAFTDANTIQFSKLSVLVASLAASILGLGFLFFERKNLNPSS